MRRLNVIANLNMRITFIRVIFDIYTFLSDILCLTSCDSELPKLTSLCEEKYVNLVKHGKQGQACRTWDKPAGDLDAECIASMYIYGHEKR